jgi:hypothetical protein
MTRVNLQPVTLTVHQQYVVMASSMRALESLVMMEMPAMLTDVALHVLSKKVMIVAQAYVYQSVATTSLLV